MATYSFRIKKGKYQLDVVTTDKDLLVSQFELWVRQASDYTRKKKAKECKDLVQNQIKAEEEITKKNIETQLSKQQVEKPIAADSRKEDTKQAETSVKEDSKVENKKKIENLVFFVVILIITIVLILKNFLILFSIIVFHI